MDQIQICNWLLTRRCNLRCSYCAIVRNYKGMPDKYPRMSHYFENEMSTEFIIEMLRRLKLHNANMFHICYGGEPLLHPGLPEIINYCNKENIHYTIISNNSPEIEPLIENLFAKVDYINGFTASIDPVLVATDGEFDKNRVEKSEAGYIKMVTYQSLYKNWIKDLVAEITVDNETVKYLYKLVKLLTNVGISSDITFLDIAKNSYYDFSNISDKKLLVRRTPELEEQFDKIFLDKLDVHMGRKLCDEILRILPSNLYCDIDKDVHNITIDADGNMRACLRLRGIMTPQLRASSVILENGTLNLTFKQFISKDKDKYCRGCNWPCIIQSKLATKGDKYVDSLIHTDRRIIDG